MKKTIKIIYKIKQDTLDKQDGIVAIVSFAEPIDTSKININDLHKYGAKKEIKIKCEKIQVSDQFAIEYVAKITEEQLKELLDF